MATYSYISNNPVNNGKPKFDEVELSDDEVAFKEAIAKKGYLTRDESIYFGHKQFDLEKVAILEEETY